MQFLFQLPDGLVSRSFFAAAGVAVLFAVGVAGCDATVDTEDGGGEGECCLMDPQCPEGTLEVSECLTSACSSVEACCTQKLCEPAASCTAEPSCEPFEVEVATCEGSTGISCREVTDCGSTIFCEEPEFCTAVPVCDKGDEEVPGCPNDGSPCYQVELCGSVISCVDNGLPHGCPETPPTQGQFCESFGQVCNYPIDEVGCYDSWTCADQFAGRDGFDDPGIGAGGGSGAPRPSTTWQPLGTVCEPSPGN
jgi:hypothetical protein